MENAEDKNKEVIDEIINKLAHGVPDLLTCEWCEKQAEDFELVDEMLTGVFGYVFCSIECRDAWLDSK